MALFLLIELSVMKNKNLDSEIIIMALIVLFLIGTQFFHPIRMKYKDVPLAQKLKVDKISPPLSVPQEFKKTPFKKNPLKKDKFPKEQKGSSKDLNSRKKVFSKNSPQKLDSLKKTWFQASQKVKDINFISPTTNNYNRLQEQTRRFSIKIELPEPHRGIKFKLQYRQPPKFGEKKSPQPHFLKTQNSNQATFSIEKSITSESPWNHFNNP